MIRMICGPKRSQKVCVLGSHHHLLVWLRQTRSGQREGPFRRFHIEDRPVANRTTHLAAPVAIATALHRAIAAAKAGEAKAAALDATALTTAGVGAKGFAGGAAIAGITTTSDVMMSGLWSLWVLWVGWVGRRGLGRKMVQGIFTLSAGICSGWVDICWLCLDGPHVIEPKIPPNKSLEMFSAIAVGGGKSGKCASSMLPQETPPWNGRFRRCESDEP